MPLSLILSIVSVLMVIGIISITDSLLKLFFKKKTSPADVIVHIKSRDEPIEYIIKKIIKKYPCSNIIIEHSVLSYEEREILDIIKKNHPYILVK